MNRLGYSDRCRAGASDEYLRENSMNLNNEKRIIASQIIVELFESKQKTQLEILKLQVDVAVQRLGGTPAREVVSDET